jgi:hypothetical protein
LSIQAQRVFDSLKEVVYREAFLDVRCDVRDLKNLIEELQQAELDTLKVDEV